MQFKKAGRKIQVLAYRGYDKEKKRAIVKMLGSLDDYDYKPTVGLIESLTDDEKKELQSYIENDKQSKEKEGRQSSVKYIHSLIDHASDSLTNHGATLSDSEAGRLWESIDALGKALKKAGHRRPKPAAVARAEPGQAALTFDTPGA